MLPFYLSACIIISLKIKKKHTVKRDEQQIEHAEGAQKMSSVVHRHRMGFNRCDINENQEYTGEPIRVYNWISDSYKVDIKAGHKLHQCKKKEGDDVYAHFKLVGKGCHTDCACGACGFNWEFAEDECFC